MKIKIDKRIKLLLASAVIIASAATHAFAWKYQGVVYEANDEDFTAPYGSLKSARQMQHLLDIGVNTLSFSPSAYQKDMGRPEISFDYSIGEGMEKDIAVAKRLGFFVIMQPTLESISTGDDEIKIREPISMRSAEEWRRWFANYEYTMIHFAAIAERLKVDVLVIGNEYDHATNDHDEQWRHVIRSVRAVYQGRLTYAASGLEEAHQINFWADLDAIGINAAFQLTTSSAPTTDELHNAWKGLAMELGALSKQNADRPIILTQLGYFSVNGTSQRPMTEPLLADQDNPEEQAQCFNAAFDALKRMPWAQGIIIWKYKISVTPKEKSKNPSDAAAVFQDKPAEAVIQRYFLGPKSSAN